MAVGWRSGLLWRQNYPQVAALQLVSSFVLQNSVTCPEKKLEKAMQSRPSDYAHCILCKQQLILQLLSIHVQRFAGRLSEENRQGIPCGFVSTLHITTSGLSPALWFIQCTCTLQNHKVHPVCLLLTIYLQSAVQCSSIDNTYAV